MEHDPVDWPRIFADVCCGNQAASEFCFSFLALVHFVDDVIDGETAKWQTDQILRVNLELIRVLSFNPFWEANKNGLFPLVLMSVQQYADSLRWVKREDFRERATSDVLKSQYQDVFWHVAYLCGGYQHMDAISQKYRLYHYDAK